MSIKILHISDNHSLLIDYWTLLNLDPKDIDCIVISGDFCPNYSRGVRAIEEPRQEVWLHANASRIAEWTRGVSTLFVPGNHDFVDVPEILNKLGLDNIIDLYKKDDQGDQQVVDFEGYRLYGSPWVNWFTGEWNYEISSESMNLVVEDCISKKPDIIVSHCPIRGVLDRNEYGDRCGSVEWRDGLTEAMSNMENLYIPKAFLHGHIHPPNGILGWKSVIVSNAATTANLVYIRD